MWHLTKLALRSRIATILIAILLAGASIWALMGLKMELIPNIDFPFATIVTVYPEATADTVVSRVSEPIEQAVWNEWSGRGLKHVTSTSSSGLSVVMAEFEFGTDMENVASSIEAEIGRLTMPEAVVNFPKLVGSDTANPQVVPINLSVMPVMDLSVSGDLSPEDLKGLAITRLVPELEKIDGVLRVEVEGGEKDQVVIAPDPDKMNQHGVSIAQIAALLDPRYTSLSAIGNTPLGNSGVKLADVARVTTGPPPRAVITRADGRPSIGISIVKEEKANTVEVANAVTARIPEFESALGEDMKIGVVFDQSTFIESSITQLWEKAVVGGALAILIVFFFLWAVRASLVTAISIPLSVLMGFLGMRLAGITINILTLSAMSIAVGRLIDDSIVMVEIIFRRLRGGEGFIDAAVNGAKEVANPITTATLATVAIFIPLMFIGGIIGEMFVPFALTVTFAMMASLLVALMVVPALSRLLVSNNIKTAFSTDNWYQRAYSGALTWSLRHRAAVLSIAVVLFFGSLGLLPLIGTSFMAGMGDESITVEIQMPANTEFAALSDTTAKVEALLTGNKAVKNFHTTIGSSGSFGGMMGGGGSGGSTATITAYTNPGTDLVAETESLSKASKEIAGATIVVSNSESGGGFGFSSAVTSISVQGKDEAEVARITGQLMERLNGVDGLANIESDLTKVVPKLNIAIDPAKIGTSGLPAQQMGGLQQEFMLLMVGGTVPGKTLEVENGSSHPVFIQGIAGSLTNLEQARTVKIGYPQSVALSAVANVSIEQLPSHVVHTDTSLSATISGAVVAKNVGAVNAAIQRQINALPEHPGIAIKMGGMAEQMEDSFSRMFVAIGVAIVIVFAIVILMMRSIRNPLIIMVSLPLASIGALVALAVSGYTLSVSGMMGLLMLVGIVLTNAIVLVALVEELRKKGSKSTREALLEGGKTRLRPILMTALTTIFAMIPLAVGVASGTVISAELAIVVIGGMFSSTLLTLFVIPVIYSLVHKERLVPDSKRA